MRKVAMTLMLALLVFSSGAAVAETWPMPPDMCDLEAGPVPGTPALILVLGCPTSPDSTCPVAPSAEDPGEDPELVEEPGPVSGVMVDPMGKFNRPWTAGAGPDCNGIAANTSVDLNRLVSLLQSIMLCETNAYTEW